MSTALITVGGILEDTMSALFVVSLLISLFCSVYNTLIPTIRKIIADRKITPEEIDELVDAAEEVAEEIKDTAEKIKEMEDENDGNKPTNP